MITQTTYSTDLIVSLDDFRAHLRTDADDTVIQPYLLAAQEFCEKFKGEKFYTTLFTLTIDAPNCVSDREKELRSFASDINYKITLTGNVSTVDHITYYDVNNTLQTLSASAYRVSGAWGWGEWKQYILFNTIPAMAYREDAIKVYYTCGYPTDEYGTPIVPETIKQAIRMLAAEWYLRRESNIAGTIISPVPITVERLLRL